MIPTHDPASVPVQGAPEPPRALRAPPAAPPWLAPSTTLRAPGESSQGTVTRSLRLPTVAECAELLAAGWAPLLGRLGVWVDDSGDSGAVRMVGVREFVEAGAVVFAVGDRVVWVLSAEKEQR